MPGVHCAGLSLAGLWALGTAWIRVGSGDETGQRLRESCPHSTLLIPETQMSWPMVTEMLKSVLKHNY